MRHRGSPSPEDAPSKTEAHMPLPKRRPRFLVEAVTLLTTQREDTGGWSVSIAHKPELTDPP